MKSKSLTKRITAVLFSLVLMVCMLPVNVFAADATIDTTRNGNSSLTINKTDDAGAAITDTALEYTIYKVATLSQSTSAGAVSMQYNFVSGVTLTGGGTALTSTTTAADFNMTSVTANVTGVPLANTGTTPGTLVFSGLDFGLYLVVETGTPAGVTTANNFLVSIPLSETVTAGSTTTSQWVYDVVAAPKNTVADGSVAKTITAGASSATTSTSTNPVYTASVGDVITYEVEAVLPSSFTSTAYTTYKVIDTPDVGLTIYRDGTGIAGSFDGITVMVGTTPLVKNVDYTIAADTSGRGFVIEFILTPATASTAAVYSTSLTDSAVIKISYDAAITSTTATSFGNSIQAEYNYIGGPTTPPTINPDPTHPVPTVKTFNYALQKVDDSATPAPLDGATFVIKNAAGQYLTWDSVNTKWGTTANITDAGVYEMTSATASGAIVSFNGLKEGSYDIVEKTAPTGYSLLSAPITVTIDQTSTTAAAVTNGYSIQVVNALANSFVLPGTGGMGIYLYTIGGVVLIAAAIILFTRNRKKSNV